jgi:K+-transporting ATPase ATPase C chain
MLRYFAKSALLLGITVVVMCGVYPGVLWLIGQTVFPYQANGSIVRNADGAVVGSMLVAQPFTKDEYFQPRPSAANFDASASASSALAPSTTPYATASRAQLGRSRPMLQGRRKANSLVPTSRFGSKPTNLAETRTSLRSGPTPITVWRKAG